MWMGIFPMVFISDIDVAREAFRKNDFAGRPVSVFGEITNYVKFKLIKPFLKPY